MEAARKTEEINKQKKRIEQQSHWTRVAEQQREEAIKYSRYCAERKAIRLLEKEGLHNGVVPTYEQWEHRCDLDEAGMKSDIDDCDDLSHNADEDQSDFCDIVDGDFDPDNCCGEDTRGRNCVPCRPTELMRIMKAADPRTFWGVKQVNSSHQATEMIDEKSDLFLNGMAETIASESGNVSRKKEAANRAAKIREDISSFNVARKKKHDRIIAARGHSANSNTDIEDENMEDYFSRDRINRAAIRLARTDHDHNVCLRVLTDEQRNMLEMEMIREKYQKQFAASQKLQQVLLKLENLIQQSELNYKALFLQIQQDYGTELVSAEEELIDLRSHIDHLMHSRDHAKVKKAYVDEEAKRLNQEMRDATQRSLIRDCGKKECNPVHNSHEYGGCDNVRGESRSNEHFLPIIGSSSSRVS